jgi:protein-tyrosine phosphatase
LSPERARDQMGSMIDLHCHLLPGIDDGPATMDETIAMARAAAADGSQVVVATPHVSWTFPRNTAAVISAKVDEVRAALSDAKIGLDIRMGAEVEVTRAVQLDDADLRSLRLGDGAWLLVECPLEAYSSSALAAAMRSLASRGHHLVLAHPERSRAFQRDPDALKGLVADGMVTCITAAALSGRFGRTSRGFATALVRDGLAHVVASDAHDSARRSPRLRSELEAAGLGLQAAVLAGATPAAILEETRLPVAVGDPVGREGQADFAGS